MNVLLVANLFILLNEIVAKYNRKSTRLVGYIVEQLRKNISASNIAKNLNIDSGFISKMLSYLSFSTSSLYLFKISLYLSKDSLFLNYLHYMNKYIKDLAKCHQLSSLHNISVTTMLSADF